MNFTNDTPGMEIGGEVYVQRRNGTIHLATIKEIDYRSNRVLVGFWESDNLNLRLKNVDMNKVIQLNKDLQAKTNAQKAAPSSQMAQQQHEENVQEEPLNLKISRNRDDEERNDQDRRPIRTRHYETGEQYEIFVLEEMLRDEIRHSSASNKIFVQRIQALEEQLEKKDELIKQLQLQLQNRTIRNNDEREDDTSMFVM